MSLDKATQMLAVQAHCNLPDWVSSQMRFKVGEAGAGRAVQLRRSVVMADTTIELGKMIAAGQMPGNMPQDFVEAMASAYKSLVSVPLLVRDEPYGAISLYYRRARHITDEDVRLAESVGNQAGLAIESERLREQAELSAAVSERNRLARELHDSVTQNLYSVTLYAEATARLLESGSDLQAADYLRDLRDTSQEALREMRLLIFELRPPELEKTGLAGALQIRLQSVEARGGMQTGFDLEGVEHEARLPIVEQQELYYIAQEALNNALKHAHARRVTAALHYEPAAVTLEIADDGIGLDLSRAARGGRHGAAQHPRAGRAHRRPVERGHNPGQRHARARHAVLPPCGDEVKLMQPKIRVLITDDHAIVRKGISALLATEPDIEVVGEASDGTEAVAQAQALKPDVVLMDLVMPRMDGIEATRLITGLLKETRVLVLTSFAADDKVFPAIKAGALGYLLKDSGPFDLLHGIRQVYHGQPTLEPSIASKVLFELAHPAKDPLTTDPLTAREMDVLRQVAQGRSNKEIAEQLVITELTVRTHVSNILGKLHLASRTQAALYALREGLASLDDIPTFRE